LFWIFRELSKQCGKEGKLGYRLAIFGLILNLVSNFLSDFWYLTFIRKYPFRDLELFFSSVIVLSAIIFIFGIVKLLKTARLLGVLENDLNMVLFLSVSLGLPLMFMFPMFDRRRYAQTSMPFGLFYENNIPDVLTYGLGALLLILGAWLITRLRVPRQPNSDVKTS
jgi:hypothetical protein